MSNPKNHVERIFVRQNRHAGSLQDQQAKMLINKIIKEKDSGAALFMLKGIISYYVQQQTPDWPPSVRKYLSDCLNRVIYSGKNSPEFNIFSGKGAPTKNDLHLTIYFDVLSFLQEGKNIGDACAAVAGQYENVLFRLPDGRTQEIPPDESSIKKIYDAYKVKMALDEPTYQFTCPETDFEN